MKRISRGEKKHYFWYGKDCPVPKEAETNESVNKRNLIANSAKVHKSENHERKYLLEKRLVYSVLMGAA